MKAAMAREQPWTTRGRARELHRRVNGLRAAVGEEHGVQARSQAAGKLLGEHPGQRGVVDLDAVDQPSRDHRLENLAHIGVVVTKTRESLTRVEVEIGPTIDVVQVGAPCRYVVLVEAEDSKNVDKR